jgi:hypothetical protein
VPATPQTAGLLWRKLRFQQRGLDANQERNGPWLDIFACQARVQYLRGTDPVMAERLAGLVPCIVTVRRAQATMAIEGGAWQALDARDATKVFDIIAAAPDEKRTWIELTCRIRVGQAGAGDQGA